MAAYRWVDDLVTSGGLPVHQDQLRAQRSVTSMESLFTFYLLVIVVVVAAGAAVVFAVWETVVSRWTLELSLRLTACQNLPVSRHQSQYQPNLLQYSHKDQLGTTDS